MSARGSSPAPDFLDASQEGYLPYTGIGSRRTPPDVLATISSLSCWLSERGFTLRSGGAPGADAAFETSSGFAKEIFLPWKGFNGNTSILHPPSGEAMAIAAKTHPFWPRLSPAGKKLHARNVHQVLGKSLDSPSLFVVFYAREREGQVEGGTATAVNLARSRGIRTFNLASATASEIREFCAALIAPENRPSP